MACKPSRFPRFFFGCFAASSGTAGAEPAICGGSAGVDARAENELEVEGVPGLTAFGGLLTIVSRAGSFVEGVDEEMEEARGTATSEAIGEDSLDALGGRDAACNDVVEGGLDKSSICGSEAVLVSTRSVIFLFLKSLLVP